MKVVLDTNVLIAALVSQGTCCSVLEHCVQRHVIVISDFILNELRSHLTGKFKYSVEEAEEAIELFQSAMEVVIPVKLERVVSRDPDDDMILATAIAGNAECIITGDQDLLVLCQFQRIRILRPSEFAEYDAQGA